MPFPGNSCPLVIASFVVQVYALSLSSSRSALGAQGCNHMWIARIFRGVLQVSTDSGVRYLKPRLWERLRLLWTFRNFRVLPQEVLTQRQRRLIHAICSHRMFTNPEHIDQFEVIGTLEMAAGPLKFSPASQGFGASRRRVS